MANCLDNEILVKSDELLKLDALLSEVDTELKSVEPHFNVNSSKRINAHNVENFLLCKFNEYSSDVYKPLAVDNYSFGKDINKEKVFKRTAKNLSEKEIVENKKITNGCKYMETSFNSNEHTYIDPIFGLRILGPQISSALLLERMEGRKFVTFDELSRQFEVKTASDWVIAAVLLSKELKSSSKDSSRFTIWRLSDLEGNIKTISVFLFQNAHNELWHTSPGTCVAILNPTLIEKNSYRQDIAKLSIENAKKVLILGKSKDFGVCKGKKLNGQKCTNFINLQESDFCIFHIQKEFKKVARPFAAKKIKLDKYQKVQTACSKSTSAQLSAKTLIQKDRLILDTLNYNKTAENIATDEYNVKSNISSVTQKFNNYGIASKVEPDVKQRKKDLERVKSLYLTKSSCNTFTKNRSRIELKGI
nr:protein MCM10 homolog [Bactrocera oleae]